MKKFSFFTVLMTVFTLIGMQSAAAQCGGTAVLTGCIGDQVIVPTCQFSFSETYMVTSADVAASPGKTAVFCLGTISSSLCPNTSAIATVQRNGHGNRSVDLNNGETLRIRAKEGDLLTMNVNLVARNNGIQCFRLGDTQFALTR